MKVENTVKCETIYIALMTGLLSVIMQSVFLIFRIWDYTVLLGNLLGGCVAVLNFFLMGLTVQKAVSKDEKNAASIMKLSQTLRMFMILTFSVLGVLLKCFNIWSTLIPLFFPRIAIIFRPLFNKYFDNKGIGG